MNRGLIVGGAAVAVIAGAGGLAYATAAAGSQLFGQVLVAPMGAAQIALTFDDGPNPAATPYLLDLLARHGVRATFFLIGRYALAERLLVRRVVEEGHAVGNHTMTHPRLPLCSHARIAQEIDGAQKAIEDVAGTAVRLFRPPHGYRTPYVLCAARERGMVTTTWNVIGNDWKLPTAERITRRVEAGMARNRSAGWASNVVLHDGSQATPRADRLRTVAATAMLLAQSKGMGLRFVMLEEWL